LHAPLHTFGFSAAYLWFISNIELLSRPVVKRLQPAAGFVDAVTFTVSSAPDFSGFKLLSSRRNANGAMYNSQPVSLSYTGYFRSRVAARIPISRIVSADVLFLTVPVRGRFR